MKQFVERTLVLAKPDAVRRGLVGEIIKRFEQRGFRIAGLKVVVPSEAQVGMHYADDPVWKENVGKVTRENLEKHGVKVAESNQEIGARIRQWNMESLSNLPVVAVIFEGLHAVEIGRNIVGFKEPKQAQPGTIRGDFGTESFSFADNQQRVIRNLVHASGSVKEAENEISVWFGKNEVFDYEHKLWELMH